MKNNIIINKIGYGEMYEWETLPSYVSHDQNKLLLGRFVTFSKNDTSKIVLSNNNDYILGVTSINYAYLSDNPEEWSNKYMHDEYGNTYLEKKIKYYGNKKYDSLNELYFVNIKKSPTYSPMINNDYDEDKKYIPRNRRKEWVCVNLIGKCIVEDNGECKAGEFCSCGNDGIAIPGSKYYILKRISKNTILIVLK